MVQISVILPVYNGVSTITDTINSVLGQTFQEFELIVIDDGSTDDTVSVIETIKDDRLRIHQFENAGQGESRNRGAALAQGEYLSFIDADDLWTPDKLESQWQALQTHPQAAVAYSWTDHIDENNQFFRAGPHLTFSGDVYKKLIISDFVGSGSNVLIRKAAFDEVGGFAPHLTPAEDWDLWVRLAARYEFVVVPQVHILYRTLTTSSSFNLAKMEASSVQVMERIFAQAPPELQGLSQLCRGHRYKYLTYKALDLTPQRQRARAAFRFLALALWYDLSLWRRRVIWKVLLRATIAVVFPRTWVISLLKQQPKPFDIEALLFHIRFEV
ncbi:glycosyltransferase [Sodalinema gerasimenkoae]|uniref:glycosyltransferase n=1 Tax=Sodalinema gerasimenkoae TaxID=2862348 RepID=UPI001359C63D|nr:glycosyltransferase [Sodalinema gerasimenkoae]